ncbi:MAG: Omp28-related outer membrane protein [Bacteroidota bacterium]
MKNLFSFILAFFLCNLLIGQELVSTDVTNKMVILEEFTGTNCPACPGGHETVKQLLETNENVIAVAYSPFNSGLTSPYQGGADLRRSFPNAFYTNPYYGNGDGRSMPSGHINRRVWNETSGRKVRTGSFRILSNAIDNETTPVNIGLESLYDESKKTLSIDVEMYMTSDITEQLGLYVYITENEIIANQSGSNQNPYTHFHVLREIMNQDQWGDDIMSTTNEGDIATANYFFNMADAIDPINIENAEVVAFVVNKVSGEILTGVLVHAENGTTRTTSSVRDVPNPFGLRVFPNPVNEVLYYAFTANGSDDYTVSMFDISGKEVIQTQLENRNAGMTYRNLYVNDLPSGNYSMRVSNGKQMSISKVIVQH